MITLVAKELRQLLPIALFWLALLIAGYLTQLTGTRIDEQSFASWCAEYCQPGLATGTVVFYLGLILITAYSLFPREFDESTIDFLRSLPVTAGQIFIAKLLAAWLLLCSLSVLAFAIDAALLSLDPQSIDGRSYPVTALQFLLRDAVFLFIILAHGIFISWFRTVGLIIYVGYLVLIVWAETQLGSTGAWNVLRVLENEYAGQTLIVDRAAIATHLLVAVVLLWISFRLWRNQETEARSNDRRRSVPRWLAILGNTTAFAVLAALLLGYLQVSTHDGDEASAVQRHSTQHYRFNYGANQRKTMEFLSRHADDDLLRLATLLGSEQRPVIATDLTTRSEHLLGRAQWKRINMDVSGFLSDDTYRRVLSHETVHVFQAIEADRAFTDYGNATRFFVEGMAQFLSFQLVPEPARLYWNRQLAAVAWKRQHIRFEDLIDDSAFGRRFDTDLYYSVGELWTAALVGVCGERVPGDLLRAAGRENAPKGLSATAFWRDTLQSVDCELESVNARWRRQMQKRFDSADQAAFPVFDSVRVNVSEASDTLVIRAGVEAQTVGRGQARSGSAAEPARWQLRVASETRLAAGVPRVYYGKRVAGQDELTIEYRIPRSDMAGERFRYQLGYTPNADSRSYFERWQSASAMRRSRQ